MGNCHRVLEVIRRILLIVASPAFFMAALLGCGGGTSQTPTPPQVSVSVTPSAATVPAGSTQSFFATVRNTTNTAVTWDVNGTVGGDANVGTITAAGLYTAPLVTPAPATVTVHAVLQADTTKSGSATVTIPPISVDVLPQNPVVEVNLSQQFSASVNNHPNQAVTWQLSGVGGLSTQGLYTAPASVPDVTAITVTAVSQQDNTKSGSAPATVVPVITVDVTPPSQQLTLGATQQFNATVSGVINQAVAWRTPLHEVCDYYYYYYCFFTTDPRDGVIDAAGLYTAPLFPPNDSGTIEITAASQVNPAKVDTAQVQIIFGNAGLNGRYSFYLRGRKPAGGELLTAGVFTADGQGTITAGVMDRNDSAAGVSSSVAFTGTYTVGPDGRGTATLNSSLGTTFFRFVLVQGGTDPSTNGTDATTQGLLIEFDGVAAAEGTLMRANPVTVAASYVYGATGFTAFGTAAVAGQFTTSGTNVSSGREDRNLAGVVNADLSVSGSFTAPVNDRGTINLTTSQGTARYSFYPLDQEGNRLLLMGLDASPALLGFASPQATTPTNALFSGDFVFSRSGTTSGQALTSAGRFTSDGLSAVSSGVTDENLNGTTGLNLALTGTYNIAANGRGTAAFSSNQVTTNLAFYLATGDFIAFFVQTDAGSVTAGRFERQSWAGSTLASLDGRHGLLLSVAAIGGGPSSQIVLLQADSGNFTGTGDINNVSSQLTDAAMTGTYSVEINGRTTILLSPPSGALALRMYLLNPSEGRVVGVDATRLVTGTLVRRF